MKKKTKKSSVKKTNFKVGDKVMFGPDDVVGNITTMGDTYANLQTEKDGMYDGVLLSELCKIEEPLKKGDRVMVGGRSVMVDGNLGTVVNIRGKLTDIKLDIGIWEAGRKQCEFVKISKYNQLKKSIKPGNVWVVVDTYEDLMTGKKAKAIGAFSASSVAEQVTADYIEKNDACENDILLLVAAIDPPYKFSDKSCSGKMVEIDGKKYRLEEV